jgi:hypothetical protein
MEAPDVSEEAVRTVIRQRFGDKVVSFDPSDPEANNRAVANGFTVVHGRSLSEPEWEKGQAGWHNSFGGNRSSGPKPVKALEPTQQEQRIMNAMNRMAQAIVCYRKSQPRPEFRQRSVVVIAQMVRCVFVIQFMNQEIDNRFIEFIKEASAEPDLVSGAGSLDHTGRLPGRPYPRIMLPRYYDQRVPWR